MFNLGVDIEKINIGDEFILSWLMDKITYMEDFNKEEAREAKDHFFTEYFLDNIIEEDELLFHRMFTFLSPERFNPLMDKLLEKWPSWHDLMAYDSAPVIAKLLPSKAYDLFLSYISGEEVYEDRFKIKGIINSIQHFPEKEGKELSFKLIDSFLSSSLDIKEKSHFILDMMVLSWKYDHKFELFVKMADELRKEPEVFEDFFRSMAVVFTGNDEYYDLFYTGYNWGTEWNFSITPEFFLPELSLEEFDEGLESFFDNEFEAVTDLFNKYAHLISDERARNFIKNISSDVDFVKDYETEEKVIFYSFIFSSIMPSIMVKEINLSGLDINRVMKLLDLDMRVLPSMEAFAEFFSKADKGEIVNILLEKFDEEHTENCHIHIINIMGELNYGEFLEPLFENLYFEDDDDVLDALKDAFFKFNDRFLDYFVNHLSNMDKSARLTCLEVARRMESRKFLNFIEKNFDALWINNKDFLADVMELFPKETFIKKLLPLLNKGNFMIDKTCLILAKLLDYPLSDMDMIEDRLMEQEERVMKIQESLDEGEPSEFLEPHIYLELKCNECNDESTYKVEHVDVDLSDKENISAVVKDTISCINCNKQGGFEVTEEGKTVILGRMMFLMTIEDEEVKEKIGKPITFVNEPEIDDEDFEEYLLYKIEEEPQNPDNYIYMANHYRNNKKDKKSEEFLKKAMEFEKSYPEIYFALADIYACRRKYKEALDYLENGKKYLYTGKYRKDFDDMESFIDAYNQFYDDMSHMCGEKSVQPAKVNKVGRNDPCPCGSGKKYKKCCLML